MEEESSYSIQEAESSSDSDTESDEDEIAERASNPFARWKKIYVAVSSDFPVWIGIEAEREIKEGGQTYDLEIAGIGGVGLGRSVKEHHFVSRIPWLKGNPHE